MNRFKQNLVILLPPPTHSKSSIISLRGKELYTGTPNSDIRTVYCTVLCVLYCTVHCGRNVNKPSAPTEVEGKSSDVIFQSNNKTS